jgi:protein CpxP
MKRLAAGVVIAITATIALSAWAQPMGGHHGGGFGGPGMFMGSPEHIDRGVDHLVDRLNATDAQRTQIKQIVQQAAADLKAQHESARGLHEKGLQIFTAPTVTRQPPNRCGSRCWPSMTLPAAACFKPCSTSAAC